MQAPCLHSSLTGRQVVWQTQQQRRTPRTVSRVECKQSRIGKAPVPLPKGVTVTISGQDVTVKGPKGELKQTFPDLVDVQQDGERLLVTKREFRDPAKSRQAYSTHGLVRSLVQGMVEGTSTGFTKELIMTGVGYRGAVSGTKLTLNLGYSNPVEIDIPKGISVQVQKNTNLSVTGHDKCQVGDFSSYIRSRRPPEPYKGKGIRYSDEVIRRKEGKRGK